MHFDSLNTLFVHELRDIYSAEKQLLEALPKMTRAASSPELKKAFEEHLEQTRFHLDRLNEAFNNLNITAVNSVTCQGMEGIIREGEEIVNSGGDPAAKDAALISAAQRAEHYEMAAYGAARTFADQLGHDHASKLLQKTLDEEGATDKKLTKLAEGTILSSGINKKAM
jgi:ferritin-like metal-binding protein YciE